VNPFSTLVNTPVGKALNHVAIFQVVLAVATGREPPGSGVAPKGIVEGLRQLVAERGDIADGRIRKDAWGNPAGVVDDVTLLQEAVGRAALLEIVGVEAEDAAIVGVTDIEIRVWKEEGGNIAGANLSRGFRGPNRRGGVRPRKRRGE